VPVSSPVAVTGSVVASPLLLLPPVSVAVPGPGPSVVTPPPVVGTTSVPPAPLLDDPPGPLDSLAEPVIPGPPLPPQAASNSEPMHRKVVVERTMTPL